MRLFNGSKKEERFIIDKFDKRQIINDILENRHVGCPGWRFLKISEDRKFDTTSCDFIAIYTDIINKEIKINSNPFSDYKNIVSSAYQIVREIFIVEEHDNIDCDKECIYKMITARSAKELFIKLKNEV